MKRLDNIGLIRLGGLILSLVLGLVRGVSILPLAHTRLHAWHLYLVLLVPLAVFLICYWITMRDVPAAELRHRNLWLLIVEAVAGTFIHTDYLIIVAAQAPLVLGRRAALPWFGVQLMFILLLAIGLARLGQFGIDDAVRAQAPLMAQVLTLAEVMCWQLFAFCAGWFVLGEAAARRHAQALNAALLEAQQELREQSRVQERLHIARELHDSLGHNLVALKLQLQLARHRDERRAEHLDTAYEISQSLLASVREVVSELRDDARLDLADELRAMAERMRAPQVHLSLPPSLADLPRDYALTMLRVTQEGLSNALRHANARHVWVEVAWEPQRWLLNLRDDGHGNSRYQAGNGLTGMRERAQAFGGTLQIDSSGPGFTISLSLPASGEMP